MSELFKPATEFLGKVLEKGGVTGLLLVLLLGQNYLAQESAERDRALALQERKESIQAYKALSDTMIALTRLQAAGEARGTVLIETTGRALRDNTRVLRAHERRLGWRSRQGDEG